MEKGHWGILSKMHQISPFHQLKAKKLHFSLRSISSVSYVFYIVLKMWFFKKISFSVCRWDKNKSEFWTLNPKLEVTWKIHYLFGSTSDFFLLMDNNIFLSLEINWCCETVKSFTFLFILAIWHFRRRCQRDI